MLRFREFDLTLRHRRVTLTRTRYFSWRTERADSVAQESPSACRDCQPVNAASGILEMTFLAHRERILPRMDPADGNGLLSRSARANLVCVLVARCAGANAQQ